MDRHSKLRLGILTSSRADYGIYLPLLHELKNESKIDFEIIAFGTHLSPIHGYTIKEIINDGFEVNHKIESLMINDSEVGISTSMGLTFLKFAEFWDLNKERFDLVFALGDRYEMFAAVAATIPYNLKIAHIHGGEETTGAIDNTFRHSITHMSLLHFTSHQKYSERIAEMLNNDKHIITVGSLSIDNLKRIKLLDKKSFKENYDIDTSIPSILLTMHPETVALERNKQYAEILKDTCLQLADKYQLIITMPNADTMGNLYRTKFIELKENLKSKIKIIENFGTVGYFSCMHHCHFLLGNSSSGIIEAGSLNKWVINIGDRQKGRIFGKNILNSPILKDSILEIVNYIESKSENIKVKNPYDINGASQKIINYLKSYAGF
jgi:GDP/UDP-N,N'-diacetylbacillosamine 2-epimerase (hydrolysing)